jgi:hAT family C-terminal dimerisation region
LDSLLYGDDDDAVNDVVDFAPRNTEVLRHDCEAEVSRYFLRARSGATGTKCPLEWWKENGDLFPKMKPLARKWLGCVATSVPCERAFSTGGNVVTAKRCKLKPNFVEDLMFITHNYL